MKKLLLFFLPLKKNVKAAIKMLTSVSSRLREFPIAANVMHLKIGNPKSLTITN
jgi:hypothetical protein